MQAGRNRAQGADIWRDIVADQPVAAGRGAVELSIDVGKSDRETVDFRLGDELEVGGTSETPDAVRPRLELLFVEDVAQREQGPRMPDFAEGRWRIAADALARGFLGDQLGMFFLDTAEFVEGSIIFGVGDAGRIEHVVLVGVLVELLAELVDVSLQ